MTWYTKYFRNLDEVEYVFGVTLAGEQDGMIMEYLKAGTVPQNGGCWTCNAGEMRKLIAKIRDYEVAVTNGEAEWPWTTTQGVLSVLTPEQLQELRSTLSETRALS